MQNIAKKLTNRQVFLGFLQSVDINFEGKYMKRRI
ncbi:hypothetical protein SAMN03080594_103322 [Arenibacter palladensis]|uniref:Uncharacterized protein n=1 Tax=Arenibacter palladensis TaxID=237373 RepID=A0A1M5AN97_9FLAO|nr:hypothetical protein SAMN03080594_103322 [Arenibacter palladensis]